MEQKFYVGYLQAEDRSKILNEINQIHNQRFQLTTNAITAFGVYVAWLFPKGNSDIGETLVVAPALLLFFLLLLFLYAHTLNRTQITLAAYLIETGESKWERDSRDSRGAKGVGFNLIQDVIFISLGVIASLIPFILYHHIDMQLPYFEKAKLLLGVSGLIYTIIILSLSYCQIFHYRNKAKIKWRNYFDMKEIK